MCGFRLGFWVVYVVVVGCGCGFLFWFELTGFGCSVCCVGWVVVAVMF